MGKSRNIIKKRHSTNIYQALFFAVKVGKLTEIGQESEGLGTRLLCLAICSFQPNDLRS